MTLASRLLVRIVAPATEPITLAEAKLYLRLTHDDEDTLLGDLIVSARMQAEQWLRRSIITQTWKLAYEGSDSMTVALPMGPVAAIVEANMFDAEGQGQEVSADAYYLNAAKNSAVFLTVPSGFRTEITYLAGYGAPADLPRPIKLGLLAHVAALYDGRGEDGGNMPVQSLRLYAAYREVQL